MKCFMKITVITVSYNSDKTIERTINSVINQTYKDIEYIIIDGKSNDKTVDIIKKYQDKITYWVSEKDTGIYNAMNKGIKKSSGDYIEFLNADDFFIDENIISNVIDIIKDNNYPDILSAPVWGVNLDGLQKLREGFLKYNINLIKSGIMLPHQGLFYRRNILLKYQFDEEYKIVADFEQLNRCINDNKKIIGINMPVVFYSLDGISSNKKIYVQEMINVFNKYNVNRKIVKNFIDKHERNTIKYKIIDFLKKVFLAMGLLKHLKKYNGWVKHKCNNKYCNWCNK